MSSRPSQPLPSIVGKPRGMHIDSLYHHSVFVGLKPGFAMMSCQILSWGTYQELPKPIVQMKFNQKYKY